MQKKIKNNYLNRTFKVPLAIFLITLAVLSYKILPQLLKEGKIYPQAIQKNATSFLEKKDKTPKDWRQYNNPTYRFVLSIPPLLFYREYKEQTDYLLFAKFEENKFSVTKGFAIGVTDRSLDSEQRMVKEEISKFASVEPRENRVKIDGYDAVRLDYDKHESFEPRSIIVVNNGKVTISLSTTPELLDIMQPTLNFY